MQNNTLSILNPFALLKSPVTPSKTLLQAISLLYSSLVSNATASFPI